MTDHLQKACFTRPIMDLPTIGDQTALEFSKPKAIITGDSSIMASGRGDVVRRTLIEEQVVAAGYACHISYNVAAAYIPAIVKMVLTCPSGHSIITTVAHFVTCTICRVVKTINNYSPGATCPQTIYSRGQKKFEFKCAAGHRFLSSGRNKPKGCPGCVMETQARDIVFARPEMMRLDTHSIFVGNNSRMRLHCCRIRHNPDCMNRDCLEYGRAATDCFNYIRCDRDFYATYEQLQDGQVLNCDHDHEWKNSDVVITVRIFESLFGERFDDVISQDYGICDYIALTGYNRGRGIAFIHHGDTQSWKSRVKSIVYCRENKIMCIVIPARQYRRSQLVQMLITRVVEAGKGAAGRSLQDHIDYVNNVLHDGDLRNVSFENRCVFGQQPPGTDIPPFELPPILEAATEWMA